MRKMKDMRGSHVSAVRTASFRKFGLQFASSRRKNSQEIMEWKQSEKVKSSHNRLFNEKKAIEDINMLAFLSLDSATEERYNNMYIYTASVCDIILNPDYSTLDVSKKALELRIKRFKVFIEFIILFKNQNY